MSGFKNWNNVKHMSGFKNWNNVSVIRKFLKFIRYEYIVYNL